MSSTQRRNKGKTQPTLAGLFKQNRNEDAQSKSVGEKRRQESDSSSIAPTTAPPLRLLTEKDVSTPRWGKNVSLPNGPMLLLRGCVGGKNTSQRRSTREALVSLPDWNDNVTFQIYGKECRMRRRICQFSTDGKISYSYSGLENVIAPKFPQALTAIKLRVEELICDHIVKMTKDRSVASKNVSFSPKLLQMINSVKKGEGELFNYCLCNHYRDGEEYMGYHADDEKSLDPHAPIASVSLGISRNFDVRPRTKDSKGKQSRVARIALGDGDLLVMLPPMQTHYQHAIPVEKRIVGERINLTFRRVITSQRK